MIEYEGTVSLRALEDDDAEAVLAAFTSNSDMARQGEDVRQVSHRRPAHRREHVWAAALRSLACL
ncbi:MAG: hypothetical protein ACTHW1_09335 [Ancrocorticia sp.]|uniref:hypothetical protein n=1 Tax=Ancrocorticia sp. TaxID=2593684 RepID=UPI003F91B8C0